MKTKKETISKMRSLSGTQYIANTLLIFPCPMFKHLQSLLKRYTFTVVGQKNKNDTCLDASIRLH